MVSHIALDVVGARRHMSRPCSTIARARSAPWIAAARIEGVFRFAGPKLLRYIVSAAVPVDGAHWIDTGEGRSQRVLPSADQNPPTASRATRAKPRALWLSGQARNSKENLS